jgi:hypothetical protein
MCASCKPRFTAKDPLPHWAAEDKHPGWHSRRHQSREAQDQARERYQSEHGRKARQRKAAS